MRGGGRADDPLVADQLDGVLVREEHVIPGADRFLARLREREIPFLVLTNNST